MKVGECCGNCGCTYRYSTKQFNGCASAVSDRAAGDSAPVRAPWLISFKCPGCGRLGTHFGTEYSQAEAQALVRAQRRLVESSAAVQDALEWRSEVRRRADTEARAFTNLVKRRLPQVTHYLKPMSVATHDAAASDDPDWDCALFGSIPSENPSVDVPLEVRVKCREVRVQWVDHWHHHLQPGLATAPTDYEHLDRAVSLLESLLTEELLVVACYRQGEIVSGGDCPRGGEPRRPWEMIDPAHPACADSMVVRSWRGSYDRVIRRPEEASGANPTGTRD